jgi:hypothetical protein
MASHLSQRVAVVLPLFTILALIVLTKSCVGHPPCKWTRHSRNFGAQIVWQRIRFGHGKEIHIVWIADVPIFGFG